MNNAKLFATFDKAAGRYGQVVLDLSENVAKRNFLYAVSESTQLQYISKDLELHLIGEIDLSSGDIIPVIPHQLVCRGEEYASKG